MAFANRNIKRKYDVKKNKDKNRNKNTKGNYPYPWNDLLNDTTDTDLVKLSPEAISISKLDDMYDDHKSEIELLLEKLKRKETLRNKDKLKVDNYLEKKDKMEKDDLRLLEKDFKYNPKTVGVRMLKLMKCLKHVHLGDNEAAGLSIYLRLMEKDFDIEKYPEFKSEYARHLKWLYKIVEKHDMIKYQMVKKHEMMPPLNEKGFTKLDDWQKEAIKKMRENRSLILSIPTSGGKTYLSAYLTKNEGKIYFIAPSIPLARQVAAYLSRVSGKRVPFITETYRPYLYHTEMLECLKSNRILVGTPDIFLDFLPELEELTEKDSIIVDEIHMMGSNEGDSMELICKLNPKAKLLGLSATISNPEDITMWNDKLEIISSTDRFFNLQTSYWDSKSKDVNELNPLALLSVNDFVNKSVLNKDLKPTPVDIYNLAIEIEKNMDISLLGELKLSKYFEHAKVKRLELNECLEYFVKLIKFMCNQEKVLIKRVIEKFRPVKLDYENVDLLDVIHNLKETNNTPVLIFQRNTYSLMRIAKELIEKIDINEMKDYPSRLKEIKKQEKKAKQAFKKMEKTGLIKEKKEGDSKKNEKLEKKQNTSGLEEISVEHYQRPTDKYNWCPDTLMNQIDVDELATSLKKYFPYNGEYYHPIIHALWRGIGIYAEGLPDEYLVMVQALANQRKLGVVLSDKSMTFGVSMPFRNVVIYYDKNAVDDLNPLLFKQMEGRAGRRGQDTKGSVIFVGYSWNRIKELSVSEIPKIEGQKMLNKFLPLGEKLSELSKNRYNFKNMLDKNLYKLQKGYKTNRDYTKCKKFWDENVSKIEDDKNMLRMLWYSRKYDDDGIAFSYIVDELERRYSNGDISELRQVDAAYVLSFFMRLYETDDKRYKLEKPKDFDNYDIMRKYLGDIGVDMKDENKIDGRIYYSIRQNNLMKGENEDEYQMLRKRFYKFACSLRVMQNYCFYSRRVNLARILGKLFTRCKWMLWNSSPLMNFNKEIL